MTDRAGTWIDRAGTWIFLKRATWSLSFAWLPHRCRISERLIWLKRGYKGVATYIGPATPVTETHWHDTAAHFKWILSGDKERAETTWLYPWREGSGAP